MKQFISKIGASTRSVSFLNSFFSALVGLITFMLLTRVLSKADFGSWAFFISVFTMFDMLRSGMMGSAVVKFYTENVPETDLRKIERAIGRLSLRISFVSLLIPILYWMLQLQQSYPSYKFISFAFVPLALINLIPSAAIWFCHAKQNFKLLMTIRMIVQVSFMLFVLGGFFLDYNLNLIFLGYATSWSIAMAFVLFKKEVRVVWFLNREKAYVKELFNYGKYTMTTLLGSNLLKNSDTYLIMGFLGEVSVAMYSVPDRILGLIDIPVRAFTSSDFPKLVALVKKQQFEKLQRTFNKGMGLALLVVWPISIVVFFAAEELVTLIAGLEYRNSSLILRIFSIYGILLPLDRYTGIAIDALGFPKMNALKVSLMLLVNIVLDVVFLSMGYGVNAVAVVSVATYATGVLFGVMVIRKRIKLQILQSILLSINLLFSKINQLVLKRE